MKEIVVKKPKKARCANCKLPECLQCKVCQPGCAHPIRNSVCCICERRLSHKEKNNIHWEGHYNTPWGIFCIDCYTNENINQKRHETLEKEKKSGEGKIGGIRNKRKSKKGEKQPEVQKDKARKKS